MSLHLAPDVEDAPQEIDVVFSVDREHFALAFLGRSAEVRKDEAR
jgi:hypothetical protein